MLWKSLSKMALLGTERSTLSEIEQKQLQDFGIASDMEPTAQLLQAAATLGQMKKAGFLLKTFEGDMPTPVADAGEKICSQKSTHHLKLILKGTFLQALPEFILELGRHKKQLPPEQLPDILHQCQTAPEFWLQLQPALGKRAFWLMKQHPEWQALIASAAEYSWTTGSKRERLALLEYWRKTMPQTAIKHLKSTWEQESVGDRVSFLKKLEIGLSLLDEPFLEDCLDDKRKEVRLIAASFLKKLPASKLIKRMSRRVEKWIVFEKGHLEITLPDSLNDGSKRDGIQSSLKRYKSGFKAAQLGQIIGAIPPKYWEVFFQKTPFEILDLYRKNDWADLLLQATIEATTLHLDRNWMQAIFDFWIENPEFSIWKNAFLKELMEQLPIDLFNKISIQFLERNRGLLEEDTLVSQLLKICKHPWEDRLGVEVIQGFQHWLRHAQTHSWNSWQYKQLLQSAAYRCNPDLYETLKKGWDFNAPAWGIWEPEVEQFLKTLLFRKEMRAELRR